MSQIVQRIFQCDNPDCGLRFPGFDGFPRWNRCPKCRSTIHVVAINHHSYQIDRKSNISPKLPVEVLLDNIRSAFNVGSIYRTADGTGIKKIYCCGITPTPENPKVMKTALGAEGNVAWEYFPNGVTTAKLLKDEGFPLWALEDLPEAEHLYQVDLPKSGLPIILIVGNEISGIDPGILEISDRIISIPMLGKKQSYNVAVAFSIIASFLLYRFLQNTAS